MTVQKPRRRQIHFQRNWYSFVFPCGNTLDANFDRFYWSENSELSHSFPKAYLRFQCNFLPGLINPERSSPPSGFVLLSQSFSTRSFKLESPLGRDSLEQGGSSLESVDEWGFGWRKSRLAISRGSGSGGIWVVFFLLLNLSDSGSDVSNLSWPTSKHFLACALASNTRGRAYFSIAFAVPRSTYSGTQNVRVRAWVQS